MTKEEFISALRKAEEAANSFSNVEDYSFNSCCNANEVYFKMPEDIKYSDVKGMVNVNGKPLVSKMKKDFYWLNVAYNGQAYRREQMASAAMRSLEESGIKSSVRHQLV